MIKTSLLLIVKWNIFAGMEILGINKRPHWMRLYAAHDWYAKWGRDRSVRRRVRVAHHKTLPFEHDGLRVVLADAENHAASQEEGQCQHGTGSRAARWHHGQIADPVHTDTTRQPLGGLLVFDHLVQTYSLLSSPLSFPLSVLLPHSLKQPLTHRRTQTLSGWDSPPSCASSSS